MFVKVSRYVYDESGFIVAFAVALERTDIEDKMAAECSYDLT